MTYLRQLAIFLIASLAIASAQTPHPASTFPVFDGTMYLEKPNLGPTGLRPIAIIYTTFLWSNEAERSDIPQSNVIRALALQASLSPGIAVIDIENWPVTGDPMQVASSIQKYQRTIQLFKQFAPSLKVGYYGIAPIRNYWDAIGPRNAPKYKAWQDANDKQAEVSKFADVIFPSLYTFYNDPDKWRLFAEAQIREARRIAPGKSVYAFLWPEFEHGSNDAAIGNYLPGAYWRMELETARQIADGIVIWGGFHETWNENAPWWMETKAFLKEATLK